MEPGLATAITAFFIFFFHSPLWHLICRHFIQQSTTAPASLGSSRHRLSLFLFWPRLTPESPCAAFLAATHRHPPPLSTSSFPPSSPPNRAHFPSYRPRLTPLVASRLTLLLPFSSPVKGCDRPKSALRTFVRVVSFLFLQPRLLACVELCRSRR